MDKNCITVYGLRWNSMAVSGFRIALMTSCKTVLPGPCCHHKPSLAPDLFSSENSTFPGKLCDLCKIPFSLLYKNAIKFKNKHRRIYIFGDSSGFLLEKSPGFPA